jgi:hypothetical protein
MIFNKRFLLARTFLIYLCYMIKLKIDNRILPTKGLFRTHDELKHDILVYMNRLHRTITSNIGNLEKLRSISVTTTNVINTCITLCMKMGKRNELSEINRLCKEIRRIRPNNFYRLEFLWRSLLRELTEAFELNYELESVS